MTSTGNPRIVDDNLRTKTWVNRIRILEDEVRAKPGDVDSLVRLRDMRLKAGKSLSGCHINCIWPNVAKDLLPAHKKSVPAIDVHELTIEALASAMYNHGALIVRNMIAAKRCKTLCDQIDRVMEEAAGCLSWTQSPPSKVSKSAGLFSLMPNLEQYAKPKDIWMMQHTGSAWTFFSPEILSSLLELFDTLKLRNLLTGYFEDEPCLSFLKSVLRRVERLDNPADWHQDGSFMTTDIKSINLWVALSECGAGTNCPGIDLVPERLHYIVETGTNGASFDW